MNISRTVFSLLALIVFAGLPYEALAEKHIPFYVTYEKEKGAETLQLNCTGPFLRTSGLVDVSPGADRAKFYTADVNIFSPYGKWSCSICVPDPGGAFSCLGPILDKTKFTLKKDDDEVLLRMTKDKISSELKEDETVSAAAMLGDDNNKPRRDRDTHSFAGTGGDEVVITLEEDPEAGHVGEQATMILRDGGVELEALTGMLPLEIVATLPASGVYDIVVEQHGIPEELRFRGNYFIAIVSANGGIEEITPSTDVEQ